MFPYMMLMIVLYYPDGAKIQVSIDRLLADGFTVRLPLGFRADSPEITECNFLQLHEKDYETVAITEFAYFLESHTKYYNEFCITSCQPDFLSALRRLTQDYMGYIRLREQDEYTMMRELTGFSYDELQYPLNRMAWKRTQTSCAGQYTEPLLPVEIAICLDNSDLWDKFLSLNREDFLPYYWKGNALDEHPIHKCNVTHIYIGNAYCPLLMPTQEKLLNILNHAGELGMIPVIVFSTMPVQMECKYENLLLSLGKWCVEQNTKLELVLNDIGTAIQLRTLEEESKIPSQIFCLTAGTMLTKRKKDFRMPYLMDFATESEAYGQTSVDARFYRNYLQKRFGFERISYEACGYDITVSGSSDILHLPLYQMNTAGYCTMYALCTTGDRGCQKPVSQCPEYCAEHTMFYPEGLALIGCGNTLFGCDMTALNDSRTLNDLIRRGIHRLVIRL